MSKKERPLPRPPKTPFGRKKPFEDEERPVLKADEMALAAAEGRLDEYLKNELPDNEHARKLAMMMMGMTGMMPPSAAGPATPSGEGAQQSPDEISAESPPPDNIVRAAQSGDVGNLAGLLAEEFRKRTGENPAISESPAQEAALSGEEKEVLDAVCAIAAENRLSVDWIVLRALKRYLEEYRKTGNL